MHPSSASHPAVVPPLAPVDPDIASRADPARDAMYRKITWRLVPYLFLCYVLSYLDRVNVGFAKLQMLDDLKMSNAVYGLGAGIFFIGYFMFEVPSNLILHRIGARRWIARIMISWGLLSGAMMFVSGTTSFYVIRFLLGVAEAGFFPGIILYLTYWYPAHRRARIVAMFIAAIPVSGVIGGPLSGWILGSFDMASGLRGWQWMFLIEGLPAAVLGLVTLFYLDDGIRHAKWLSESEKQMAEAAIANENRGKIEHSIRGGLFSPRVLLLCGIYFSLLMGLYGVSFWLPSIISTAGVKNPLHIGLLTAIPNACAVVAMLLAARSADKHRERRWHVVVAALVGGAGLLGSVWFAQNLVLAMFAFTIATMGIMSTLPMFWSLPTAFLGGMGAAAGIAFITSVGNLAGFVGTYAIGWLRDLSGSTDSGVLMLSGFLLLAALLTLTIPARLVNK